MSDSLYPKNLDLAVRELGRYFGVVGKDDFMNRLVALEDLDVAEKAVTEADILGNHSSAALGKFFLDCSSSNMFSVVW